MIRVALADDQALVRTGFRLILQAEKGMEVVGEAENGRAAIELVRDVSPDVILMDVRMPVLDGIEATRQVAGATRVLVLTTFDLDEVVFEAIRAERRGSCSRRHRRTSSSGPSAWLRQGIHCCHLRSRGGSWKSSRACR